MCDHRTSEAQREKRVGWKQGAGGGGGCLVNIGAHNPFKHDATAAGEVRNTVVAVFLLNLLQVTQHLYTVRVSVSLAVW